MTAPPRISDDLEALVRYQSLRRGGAKVLSQIPHAVTVVAAHIGGHEVLRHESRLSWTGPRRDEQSLRDG